MQKYMGILVMISLMVLVSGCTQLSQLSGEKRSPTVSDTDGLVINKFIIDETRLLENKSTEFYLEVENVGGTTAGLKHVTLYGISGWKNSSGDVISSEDLKRENVEMSPPDISIEPPMPGDLIMERWTLRAPDLPEGIENPYTITARARYNYSTTAAINIPGYSYKEWRRRTEQGKGTVESIGVTNTKGFEGSGGSPVKVDIEPKTVIRFDTTAEKDKTYSYRLIFKNVGQGVPIGENGEDGVITGNVTLYGPANFSNCLGAPTGQEAGIDSDTLKLLRSGEQQMPCQIEVLENQWGAGTPKQMISLIFDLDYEYYIEKKADVTAVGQKEN